MTHGPSHRWNGAPDKPPVVCLPGFMGTGSDFSIVADAYVNHPTWVTPDFPDFSNDPIRSDDPWRETLEALDKIINNEVSDQQCILFGYSMGGRIALQYALKHQHKIKGLVLVGATPGIPLDEERNDRKKKDEDKAEVLLNDSIETFLELWFNQSLIQTQERIPEPFRKRMRDARYANNKQAVAYYLTALGTGSMNPVWKQLSELQIPTLIVTGEEDKKFTRIGREMMTRLPDATLKIIPDAGHAACFEQPRAFAEIFEEFLKECFD